MPHPNTSYRAVCLVALLLVGFAGANAQKISHPQFQFPLDGSRWVSPGAAILIRPGAMLDRSITSSRVAVIAAGSSSGVHTGPIVLSDDRRTLIFKPDHPFAPGETVTVTVAPGLRDMNGGAIEPWSFSFTTSNAAARSTNGATGVAGPRRESSPQTQVTAASAGDALLLGSDRYAPSDFPRVTITKSDNPTSGVLLLSNFSVGTIDDTPYLMMLDNAGVPVFQRRARGEALDFKQQANGLLTYCDVGAEKIYALNNEYSIVDSFRCRRPYNLDGHDFELLPNGGALLMGLDSEAIDMSSVVPGGDPQATVVGMVIQELDSSHNVVFQWRSLDHFQITDVTHEDLTASMIDAVHPNALQLDNDGNILLSSRALDEVTKISRSTGDIIWRWGGKHNQFTFINDSIGFSHQHGVHRIANGHIAVFDNGNFHTPSFSRAVEYELDENAKSAKLVWQYRHTPDVSSFAMGYVQRLENGNTLISWGATNPSLTEVRPDGTTALELSLPASVVTYRAFRIPGPSTGAVSLVAPADGAPDIAANALLRWNPMPAAIAYQMQLSTDSAMTHIVADSVVASLTQLRSSGLALDREFWWHVRPVLANGFGGWSDTWTFTTGLTAVVPVAPANGAVNVPSTPMFTWERVGGGPRYHLQVALDTAFTLIVLENTGVFPYGSFGSLDTATTYYWRVRWENATAKGLWSDTWSFRTGALVARLPDIVTLLAPGDASRPEEDTIRFTWLPSEPSIARYHFMLSHDSAFAAAALDTLVADTELAVPKMSLDSARYWWRVSAVNEIGEGSFGPPRSFSIGTSLGVAGAGGIARNAWLRAEYPWAAGAPIAVHYMVPAAGHMALRVIDERGDIVATLIDRHAERGEGAVSFEAHGLPPGPYFIRLATAGGTAVEKIVVR